MDSQNNRYNFPEAPDPGRGCRFGEGEEAGTVTGICGGCHKLHVTDWLADYPDNLPQDIFEVRFKNTRRGYYQNVNNLPLHEGDIVAVEASPGHDIGIISLSGDMVARQMKRVGFNPQNGEFRKIYRKAKPYDIEKWQEAIALEHDTMIRARQIAAEMKLDMKIGDVEYQGDKIKAIFYYIADERVDFRELIKVFADVFHIRVEMKQIGARQEAGRIGGIGSCGRELCCASWISSFLSVTTNAARMQDISLNPQKLAGQCSKLKCCLIYEYDDYMDARREFPRVNAPLRTAQGEYHHIKNDILGRTMSFSTTPGSLAGLVTLPISRVREIMKLNARDIEPDITDFTERRQEKENDPGFVNVIGEDSITRFDKKKKKRSHGRGDKNGGAPGGEQQHETRSEKAECSERNGRKRDKQASDNGVRQDKPQRGERAAETAGAENGHEAGREQRRRDDRRRRQEGERGAAEGQDNGTAQREKRERNGNPERKNDGQRQKKESQQQAQPAQGAENGTREAQHGEARKNNSGRRPGRDGARSAGNGTQTAANAAETTGNGASQREKREHNGNPERKNDGQRQKKEGLQQAQPAQGAENGTREAQHGETRKNNSGRRPGRDGARSAGNGSHTAADAAGGRGTGGAQPERSSREDRRGEERPKENGGAARSGNNGQAAQ